jgi:hypothetical protein
MRVVASHLHTRRVDIATAKRTVQEAAEHIAAGIGGPESKSLATRLEKVTGASIAELAQLANDWPGRVGTRIGSSIKATRRARSDGSSGTRKTLLSRSGAILSPATQRQSC